MGPQGPLPPPRTSAQHPVSLSALHVSLNPEPFQVPVVPAGPCYAVLVDVIEAGTQAGTPGTWPCESVK
jgi:hypothetical protein